MPRCTCEYCETPLNGNNFSGCCSSECYDALQQEIDDYEVEQQELEDEEIDEYEEGNLDDYYENDSYYDDYDYLD